MTAMVKMKVLVLGSKGQLGQALMGQFKKTDDYRVFGVDLPDFDITDKDQVYSVIHRAKPDWVVNASAYTLVDQAESDREKAFKVNRDGPAFLAKACSALGIPLIHLSTDYVFDGTKGEPYSESDPIAPLGVYGMSKAEGEMEVRKNCREHVIVRTSWLYGVHGRNFVKTMAGLAGERETIRVVHDQFGCPTFAGDLADALLTVMTTVRAGGEDVWGTYHCCNKGVTSWYGFACEIIERIRNVRPLAAREIIPIPGSDYPTPAKRPSYSALDCSFMEETFTIRMKDWKESLGTMLDEWAGNG